MSIVEILYIILGACIVVITVTIVWLANETIKLVKSLRKSSDDVAFMTQEVKEKVLVVTEALDRAGTAATNIIGFIEDAIEGIKNKRDQLADSIGLVTGVGEYFKKKKESGTKSKEEISEKQEKSESNSAPSFAKASHYAILATRDKTDGKKASRGQESDKVEIKKPDKKKAEAEEKEELESEPDESEDQEPEEEK